MKQCSNVISTFQISNSKSGKLSGQSTLSEDESANGEPSSSLKEQPRNSAVGPQVSNASEDSEATTLTINDGESKVD
jgi:hypothetical protein